MRNSKRPVSERRTEQLLVELLETQGWDCRRPPKGMLLRQQEYRLFPFLADIFCHSSKSGPGAGYPDAVLVDPATGEPFLVIEAKADLSSMSDAEREAENYAYACIQEGFYPLAVGIAGAREDSFEVSVHKWNGLKWVAVTYEGKPISWILAPNDVQRVAPPDGPSEIRPTVPSPEVLAAKANEINRLLRESSIRDEDRPAVVGAMMLGLWKSRGNVRKDARYILRDLNQSCEQAFRDAQKPDLSNSLHIDEANTRLAGKAHRIVNILERLNITILTGEHDYLGQLYETFFRYTGGNNTIGQYFTPRHVTSLMADLCEVTASDIVLDPACGTGGFLISAMNRIQRQSSLTREQVARLVCTRLLGFDQEPVTAALCVANMILRGDGSTGVRRGDCFTDPTFPLGSTTVVLMNPPFPHAETDVPPEDFIDRGLEALGIRGRLAAILPTSVLAKASKGVWREHVLKNNTLVAVIEMPSELFQPYASSATSVVLLEKGVPHGEKAATFVRVQYDGLTLRKGTRVPRSDKRNDFERALEAVMNKRSIPGFSGVSTVSGRESWATGAHIPTTVPDFDTLKLIVDDLLRRLTSFYTRYSPEVVRQRVAIQKGDLEVRPYRNVVSHTRLNNATALPSTSGTIGEMFDIFYGMKELHSRENIPPGNALVVSPTESYNGCYGWLDFAPVLETPFLTVAQTGSIGEAFVQLEPCAVNDDCLILLPKTDVFLQPEELFVAAACLYLEKWRFNYGRKLTPERIAGFSYPRSPDLISWVGQRLAAYHRVIDTALQTVYPEERVDLDGDVFNEVAERSGSILDVDKPYGVSSPTQ